MPIQHIGALAVKASLLGHVSSAQDILSAIKHIGCLLSYLKAHKILQTPQKECHCSSIGNVSTGINIEGSQI
jgi:hypothetical protein